MPSSESSIRKDSMCLTSCIDSVISYYGFLDREFKRSPADHYDRGRLIAIIINGKRSKTSLEENFDDLVCLEVRT